MEVWGQRAGWEVYQFCVEMPVVSNGCWSFFADEINSSGASGKNAKSRKRHHQEVEEAGREVETTGAQRSPTLEVIT